MREARDWYSTVVTGHQRTVVDGSTEKEVAFIIKAGAYGRGERARPAWASEGMRFVAPRVFRVDRRGHHEEYVDDAAKKAAREGSRRFLCRDIRDVSFEGEFDVVLNLADGAVGYLENDAENLKIFDVVSRALKRGGQHFMDVCNAGHAERFFPKKWWESGEKALSLAQFEWDLNAGMLFGDGSSIRRAAKKTEFLRRFDALYSAAEWRRSSAPEACAWWKYCDYEGARLRQVAATDRAFRPAVSVLCNKRLKEITI
jgi:hypothetical protein